MDYKEQNYNWRENYGLMHNNEMAGSTGFALDRVTAQFPTFGVFVKDNLTILKNISISGN